jgi:hypothetical protein
MQRHHRQRAARARYLAISKVRFLYGLPMYVLSQLGVCLAQCEKYAVCIMKTRLGRMFQLLVLVESKK